MRYYAIKSDVVGNLLKVRSNYDQNNGQTGGKKKDKKNNKKQGKNIKKAKAYKLPIDWSDIDSEAK